MNWLKKYNINVLIWLFSSNWISESVYVSFKKVSNIDFHHTRIYMYVIYYMLSIIGRFFFPFEHGKMEREEASYLYLDMANGDCLATEV